MKSRACGQAITDVINLAKANCLQRNYRLGAQEKTFHHIDLTPAGSAAHAATCG
ncbi:hypothetical protein [Streptomyces sp. enrichment culture]|uniref:hypothetical protein n=1 Tax=Streptomyces sp. enrichment culture TaxID=1795815 RepID=UPI003F550710